MGKQFMAVYLSKFHKTVSKLKEYAEEIIGQLNKTRFDKLVTFLFQVIMIGFCE